VQVYNELCLGPRYTSMRLPDPSYLGQLGKLKKEFEVLIFHMKKLRNNSYGYKLKDYFKKFFLSYIENILSYPIKLKYLNQKYFLSHIEETQFFSYEHRIYILMGFKSHIVKIKYSSSFYIVDFDVS